MMTVDEIKSLIMDEFRKTNCKVGNCVPMRTYRFGLYMNLNPKEKQFYDQAFSELEKAGYIAYKEESPEAFVLLQAGFDTLYDCRSDEALEEIVMSRFRQMNCEVGQGYMLRNIRSEIDRLNPIEKDRFFELLNNLIVNDFIETGNSDFLKLKQKGFDRIYQ